MVEAITRLRGKAGQGHKIKKLRDGIENHNMKRKVEISLLRGKLGFLPQIQYTCNMLEINYQ